MAVSTTPTGSGVQSVHRALDLLELVAASPGSLSIAAMAEATALPTPTVHRLARTLVERGHMRQLADRRYTLGTRLVSLGTAAQRSVGSSAGDVLADLVAELGETANLAVLSGDHAEYVAQAPSRYTMRMFTEVGRRVSLHSTGVGKALLAQLDDPAVDRIVRRAGLPARTGNTIRTAAALHAALGEVRRQGYAVDDEEQELGVRCVAVPVAVGPGAPAWLAVSVSGPVTRMTPDVVARAVPLLRAAAARLAGEVALT
jgi:IclR family acetate operon transcriptional repressor